jgi:hypothetical protein
MGQVIMSQTSGPYLFINCHPRSKNADDYKASTNIFPEQDGQIRQIYLYKKD